MNFARPVENALDGLNLMGIERRFATARALEDVTVTLSSGQFSVLLGPSGCGKSTLLRLVAGLDTPTKGRIVLQGTDITDAPPSQRDLSMVFQSYALFPHLNVADNILFGLSVRRTPRAERAVRLDKVAAMMGLSDLLHRRPSELSGGQQQRVALARAIVSEKPVCLMDEPLSNLDAKLRAEMRVEIRALQQRLGLTMVYVTHDQVEAMTMADRIVVMDRGRIQQVATPRDLYARPANTFVARFIGTPPMNLIPADALAGHIALPEGATLGVRPEDVVPSPDGIPARLVAVEYLGADQLAAFEIGPERRSARILVRLAARTPLGPDGHALTWPQNAQHLFGSDGQRLTALPV